MARRLDDDGNIDSRRRVLKMLGWTGIGSIGIGRALRGSGLFTALAFPMPGASLPAFEEILAS